MEATRDHRPFELFRYQLLPTSQQVQTDFERGIQSLNDIVRHKNRFFAEILREFPRLESGYHRLTQRIDYNSGDWVVGRLGAQKSLRHDRRDLESEFIEDWPNVTFLINNHPEIQTIAVNRNFRAFSSPSVVVEILKRNFQPLLAKFQLGLHIEARFEKQNFWVLVDRHAGRITHVKFELISPNMANISGTLKIDLKQLNADTNSQRTNIELRSGENNVLEINDKNELINSLVDYASEGGGDVSLKVRGIKRRIRTSKNVKEVEIDELTVSSKVTPRMLEVIRSLLD